MARAARNPRALGANPQQFLTAGIQYYVAGRHATRCGHYQVAASLFHNGFELIFKATLLADLLEQANQKSRAGELTQAAAMQTYSAGADRILVKEVGHSLREAWRRFRVLNPSADFSDHLNVVVAGLDRWWREQRYPGFPSGSAVSMSFGLVRGVRSTQAAGEADGVLHLYLEEMDELFAASVPLVWNAGLIRSSLTPLPRDEHGPLPGIVAYEWQNRHQVDLGPATPPDNGS